MSRALHAAPAAVKAARPQGVHPTDGRAAPLGLGLLAPHGAEQAQSGWRGPQIVTGLVRVRDQSGPLQPVDIDENLLSSGRLSRSAPRLAGMLDVERILPFHHDGKVIPVGRVRRRELVIARMLAHVERLLAPRPKPLRSGLVHADAAHLADRDGAPVVAPSRPRDRFVAVAAGVLGTDAGIGAGAIFHQVEDGTPIRSDT
ncbi:MAG: DegV family protein [Gemmatimonadota bacterium]